MKCYEEDFGSVQIVSVCFHFILIQTIKWNEELFYPIFLNSNYNEILFFLQEIRLICF